MLVGIILTSAIFSLFLILVFRIFVRFHVLSLIVLIIEFGLNLLLGQEALLQNGSTHDECIGIALMLACVAIAVRFANGVKLKRAKLNYRTIAWSTSSFLAFALYPVLTIVFCTFDRDFTSWTSPDAPVMGEKVFFALTCLALVRMARGPYKFVRKIEKKLKDCPYVVYQALAIRVFGKKLMNRPNDNTLKKDKLELLRFAVDHLICKGVVVQVYLRGKEHLILPKVCEILRIKIKAVVGDERIPVLQLCDSFKMGDKYGPDDIDELVEQIDIPIIRFEFEDGEYYVNAEKRHLVRVCSACGLAEWVDEDAEQTGEYFCSELCRETDLRCRSRARTALGEKMADFTSKAAALGVTVQGNSYFWGRNLKMVSPNARGPHGFAAEDANTYIDRAHLRDAQVVGDDNAKSGADRLVDGQLIQTKYCATGRESVNAGFGKDGFYKYLDPNGKPMQLEVPKDQYVEAIQQMEKRISEGKVPGVTDPAEAKNLIRRGNITYEQAVAITKFGTVESLLFDASRGAVIGLAAGGISFAISTALTYWRTKDINLALRSSVVLGLKTGGLTMFSYIGAQQLQRLPQVSAFLDSAININFGAHGKFVKRIGDGLYKMGGGQGKFCKKANATVKSAAVVAAVTFTITSSWEMIKLARGRISGWQCWKNIVQGAGGITGGTIGALLGGALLSPIPVVGTLVGSVIGGALGGLAGSAGAKAVMDQFGEDDSAQIIKIIAHQVEVLTRLYCLNADEINEVNNKIDAELQNHKGIIEDVYEHQGCRRQYVNSIIQPLFVEVITSRGVIDVDAMQEKAIVTAITQEMAA